MGVLATRADVARLRGRAAFGALAADLDAGTDRPYHDLVEGLVAVPPPASRAPQPDDATREAVTAADNLDAAARWWLERMRTTPWPLEERMTLLWHDHFATAVGGGILDAGPDPRLLLIQNQTLRTHALGNFRELLAAITIDGAMLQWLDGDRNVAGKPNENYARELLELFTLGTTPQVYTEQDVREAARVLTGWTVDRTGLLVRFDAARHDTGTKVVLGRTITDGGPDEYLDLIDIILSQPVCARHVAARLVEQLAHPVPRGDLVSDPDPTVVEVADALTSSGWSIAAAVRTLLSSDRFRFGGRAGSASSASDGSNNSDTGLAYLSVRQPIELAVHGAKALGVRADEQVLLNAVRQAGQRPFDPPNVGGWPVAKGWVNPTTVIARYSIATVLVTLYQRAANAAPLRLPPAGGVGTTAGTLVATALGGVALPATSDIDAGGDGWAALLGLAGFASTTLDAVRNYLARRGGEGATEAELQRGVLILLAVSPDWQVL